jgi:hypothetical protein
MAGYIHIIRLSVRTGTHDVAVTDYQVNYVDSGMYYAVAWDEERLVEFLRFRVPLSEEEAAAVLEQLHSTGRATLGDIDIPGSEATSMGMQAIAEETE